MSKSAHATLILKLCHGIFTDWSIFSKPFLLRKKGSSGLLTQWCRLESCDWSLHSHRSLIPGKFGLKIISRSRNTINCKHGRWKVEKLSKVLRRKSLLSITSGKRQILYDRRETAELIKSFSISLRHVTGAGVKSVSKRHFETKVAFTSPQMRNWGSASCF